MALTLISSDKGVITAYANGTITAGDFVKSVSSDDAVTSSGISSYAASDIKVERADAAADENYIIGVAGGDASSGDYIPVYTEGLFVVRSGEEIDAGVMVKKADSSDYLEVEEVNDATDTYFDTATDTNSGKPIGTAITGASAADKYLIILLNV